MEPNISDLTKIIGDETRSKMLLALMDGRAFTATELALSGEIMASTASSHIKKMVTGGLISERKQGRHKYFQLKDENIASLIENLLVISSTSREIKTGPACLQMRTARICYNHLAGQYSVTLFQSLIRRGLLIEEADSLTITETGNAYLKGLGFDERKLDGRTNCRSCLDWSERKSHLAGRLGKIILNDILDNNWAHRLPDSRIIHFNNKGRKMFFAKYGIEEE